MDTKLLQRQLSTASSLYYFDASEEQEEQEEILPESEKEDQEERFFDATMDLVVEVEEVVGEARRSKRFVVHREDTIEDEKLLASMYRRIPDLGGSRRRVSVKSEEWGFPGSLDRRQLAAYQEFRAEIKRRGGTYLEMIYCYKELESEPYAICRFLRYWYFNVSKTLKYMDEHIEAWEEAKKHDFYPDADVGAPLSVLLTQFPSVYQGFAREGFPVCYFHSRNLSIEGIECVTDIERLPNFIWYTMMHDIRRIFTQAIAKNPSLGR
jgi:hypothetical protein